MGSEEHKITDITSADGFCARKSITAIDGILPKNATYRFLFERTAHGYLLRAEIRSDKFNFVDEYEAPTIFQALNQVERRLLSELYRMWEDEYRYIPHLKSVV